MDSPDSLNHDRAPGAIDPTAVRGQLERILTSAAFASARSASRLLRYLVEETLAGRGDQLKEYVVGVECFQRREGYDPKADAVVRVEASRLRNRLREYYKREGADDPVAIDLPKGAYIPEFRPRLHSASRQRLLAGVPLAIKAGAAAGVALLLILGIAWKGRRDTAPPAGIQAIAVLPLENLSGDESQDYFAYALTDALTTELGRIRKLRVISGAAAMQYKGTPKQRSEIAAELGVDALVEGSVTRVGDRARITCRFVHAKTGRQLWSDSYERNLADILAWQKEVVRAIAVEVRAELATGAGEGMRGARAVHSESYDSYLQGIFHSRRENVDDNKVAIEMFERAVALDPAFAEAHAELARSFIHRFFLFTPEEKQWEAKAFAAARKALALDPELAAAHRALGRLLWTPLQGFAHERAIREYRLALDLNPNLDEARHELALIFAHIGLLDEALKELEQEMAINPISAAPLRIGQVLTYRGDYEAALAHFQSLPSNLNPAIAGYHTAWALLALGRTKDALARMEAIHRQYPTDTGGLLASLEARALAAAGDEPGAEAKIRIALEKGKGYGHFHHTAYGVACAYALLRKPEPAVRWLHEAAEDGFPCYPAFALDPALNPIRKDPAFAAFLSKQKALLGQRRAALFPN